MKTLLEIVKKTNLTLSELSEKISLSDNTLQKWIYGSRTPNPEKVDMIYYYAHEINPASWHCGIIDYYNATKNGSGTLRLLDIVREGVSSIQKTDFNLLKALQPYLSEGSARLVDEIVSKQDNNNV